MKNYLTILLIAVVVFACNNSSESEQEEQKLYKVYFEFAQSKGDMIRRAIEKGHVESPSLSFYKNHYNTILRLDSLVNYSYKLIDSIILTSEFNRFEEAASNQASIISVIDSVFNLADENYKSYYISPIKKNIDELNTSSKALTLLKLKIDLAISYCSYLDLLYGYLDSCGGWTIPELQSTSSVDSTGTVIIKLEDEVLQQYKKGRYIIIEEISRNGKQVSLNHSSVNDYTFAIIRLDSLDSGQYKIKGKVRYYTTSKGTRDYPFVNDFSVK